MINPEKELEILREIVAELLIRVSDLEKLTAHLKPK
jgi:hypothetical protein